MKTITVENEYVITVIKEERYSSSRYCDITLEDSAPLVTIVTKNKTGGKENRIDLSEEGINFLKTLFV